MSGTPAICEEQRSLRPSATVEAPRASAVQAPWATVDPREAKAEIAQDPELPDALHNQYYVRPADPRESSAFEGLLGGVLGGNAEVNAVRTAITWVQQKEADVKLMHAEEAMELCRCDGPNDVCSIKCLEGRQRATSWVPAVPLPENGQARCPQCNIRCSTLRELRQHYEAGRSGRHAQIRAGHYRWCAGCEQWTKNTTSVGQHLAGHRHNTEMLRLDSPGGW